MLTDIYSHRSGQSVVPNEFSSELRTIIENYKFMLKAYGIKGFKDYLLPEIHKHGWSDEFYLDRSSKITITSIRDKVGLCIQTGNMARMYADLLKLQALFMRGTIDSGILVLATQKCSRAFGVNVAHFERVIRELGIFEQVITMPLIVIGFDNEN